VTGQAFLPDLDLLLAATGQKVLEWIGGLDGFGLTPSI
jgi:hypothetical protein